MGNIQAVILSDKPVLYEKCVKHVIAEYEDPEAMVLGSYKVNMREARERALRQVPLAKKDCWGVVTHTYIL